MVEAGVNRCFYGRAFAHSRTLSERGEGSVPPVLLSSCSGRSNVARPAIAIDGCPLGSVERVLAAKGFEPEEPVREILRPALAITA